MIVVRFMATNGCTSMCTPRRILARTWRNAGAATALSILNTTHSQFTCGISEQYDSTSTPSCVFPLYGGDLQLIAPLDLAATIPMDATAYKFDIVLRGRRSTLFENKLEGN